MNDTIVGPAIIIDKNRYFTILITDVLSTFDSTGVMCNFFRFYRFLLRSTILVEPGCNAIINEFGDVVINVRLF